MFHLLSKGNVFIRRFGKSKKDGREKTDNRHRSQERKRKGEERAREGERIREEESNGYEDIKTDRKKIERLIHIESDRERQIGKERERGGAKEKRERYTKILK